MTDHLTDTEELVKRLFRLAHDPHDGSLMNWVLAACSAMYAALNAIGTLTTQVSSLTAENERLKADIDDLRATLVLTQKDFRGIAESINEHFPSVYEKLRHEFESTMTYCMEIAEASSGALYAKEAHAKDWRRAEAAEQQLAEARKALEEIAALRDVAGNEHFKRTGSYNWFDEPSSVQRAREALAALPSGAEK